MTAQLISREEWFNYRSPGSYTLEERYSNGYGIRVVHNPPEPRYHYGGSYGAGEGLLELAVIEDRPHKDSQRDGWPLCYTTPITGDVLGWLDLGKVEEIARKVRELPSIYPSSQKTEASSATTEQVEGGGRNARFWVYVNGGDVKLTLRPGHGLSWGRSWSHEEGWSSEEYTWRYKKGSGTVWRLTATDGTDCDGRLSTCTESYCRLDRLQSHQVDDSPIRHPDWERLSSRQRDYQAEAAGY